MPNHVRNVLKFKNLRPVDIEFILNTIAVSIHTDTDKPSYAIDFDKIIPQPRTIEECPEDCIVNKDSHVEEDTERPWFDWYTWRVRYWGTKWGAYDCYAIVGKSYIKFIFSTAWSPAVPVISKLELLGYDFDFKYADEDIGNNCGEMLYDSEHKGWQEKSDYYGLTNPVKFARNIWDRY